MPQVPSYGGQQVAPTSAPGGAFTAPQGRNFGGEQAQQFSNALQGAAKTGMDIQNDMEQQVNQVRVDDALNKARQQVLNLTYDPQNGYKSLKGDAALTRPDGKPLYQEYGDKLQSSLSDISASLGNDAQRRTFQMQANDLATSFQGGIQQHTAAEYKDYAMSTQDGTIKLGVDGAKLNWNNPDMVRSNLESVKAASYRMGSLRGDAASEIMANTQNLTSAVHQGVIAAALQNNNPTYAQQYLAQNKGEMTADDILKTTGLVNHDLDGRVALTAVQGASASLSGQIAPTNMDRLTGIVMGMESGGDPNAVGKNVPGQGTAKGSMQVMDATSGNPGFGVTPARDNSPGERARVGKDYLAAMVTKYGNPAQAMAAYNAGPGRLDQAMADAKRAGAPEKWLSYMPAETQGYVQTGMKQLGAGGGAPAFPTESAFVQTALDRLGPSPRIEQVQLTQAQAKAQYQVLDKSRKEQGDQAVMAAQQALVQNGGNFAALDPQIKAAVTQFAPDRYDNLQDYAGKLADPVRSDNLAAYNQARSNPDELGNMSDAVFESFIKQNFTQRTAREMVKLRDDEQSGKLDNSAQGLNRPVIDRVLNERLDSLRIPRSPGPKDQDQRERLGGIRAFVDKSILDAQQQNGKKMTAAEVNDHINQLFTRDVSFKNTLWYGGTSTSSQNLMSMQIGDLPSGAAQGLRQSLVTSGNRNPSNTDILNLYRKLHTPK